MSDKTVAPCHFWKRNVGGDFCIATIYEDCKMTACPFYKSDRDYEASLETARQNFIKNYGYDGYGTFRYTPNYTREARLNARVRPKSLSGGSTDTDIRGGAAVQRHEGKA